MRAVCSEAQAVDESSGQKESACAQEESRSSEVAGKGQTQEEVTQDEAQAEIARIEREANAKIELLSAAPKRARPSAGESGIIADVVASMAAKERNAQAIAAIEADAYRQIEAVEVAYYANPEE